MFEPFANLHKLVIPYAFALFILVLLVIRCSIDRSRLVSLSLSSSEQFSFLLGCGGEGFISLWSAKMRSMRNMGTREYGSVVKRLSQNHILAFSHSRSAQTTMFIFWSCSSYVSVSCSTLLLKTLPFNRLYTFGSASVYDYVKSCMEETSKDVLFTMGIQGGYVDIPKKIVRTFQLVFQDAGKF